MSSSSLDRLHHKVASHILLKNRQLRRNSQYLLTVDFVSFVGIVEEAECYFEELYSYIGEVSLGGQFITFLDRKIDYLCVARDQCLKCLETFQRNCSNCKSTDFENLFFQGLNRTTNSVKKSFQVFLNEIEANIQQLPDIYEIVQFHDLLQQTSFLNRVIVNNHKNFPNTLANKSLKAYSTLKTSLLKLQTHSLLKDHLQRYCQLIEDMDSVYSASIESLREKLNEEINKSREEIVIHETELAQLRQQMFTSEISLKEQRDVAIEKLEIQEIDLEQQIRSIDLLQTNIQGLEYQVTKLVEERERVHQELVAKRETLRGGIREIVRLEKLIAKIERDISTRMVAFQEKLESLEQKRLAILADETLTEEERERLLAELDKEISTIREKHEADHRLLKDKCEELKVLSKSVTEDLDVFKEELVRKHLDEIRELEEMKKNATPSELVLIEAKIAALQREFEENLEMLERAKARPQFLEDEFGRYYINEDGQKIYQRDSTASEYILDENGQWVKVKDAIDIQTDEKGEFFIDSFGKKIYTKKYFEDEFGKYYIDSKGKRIYLEPSEQEVVEDTLEDIVTKETVEESVSAESSEQITPSMSELQISEKIREQRASDCKYIQDTVGLPLRKGLALTFLFQPEDPIEYLAKFLEKYYTDQKRELERAQLVEKVKQKKEQLRSEQISRASLDDIC